MASYNGSLTSDPNAPFLDLDMVNMTIDMLLSDQRFMIGDEYALRHLANTRAILLREILPRGRRLPMHPRPLDGHDLPRRSRVARLSAGAMFWRRRSRRFMRGRTWRFGLSMTTCRFKDLRT